MEERSAAGLGPKKPKTDLKRSERINGYENAKESQRKITFQA